MLVEVVIHFLHEFLACQVDEGVSIKMRTGKILNSKTDWDAQSLLIETSTEVCNYGLKPYNFSLFTVFLYSLLIGIPTICRASIQIKM